MNFTLSQREAIEHIYGPCLVLAGPGSGKTAVLTRRIRNLVTSGISPESILVITFTKASALEMQERFNGLMDGQYCPVTFGTFHSCFYGILRQELRLGNDSIIMGNRRLELLKEVASAVSLDPSGDSFFENLSKELSYIKNMGIAPDSYISTNFSTKEISLAYEEYERIKKKNGLIDFDDMLSRTYELFVDSPKVLGKWQNRFPFILIDEAQDMNDIQYRIIKLLSGKTKNVFIVGDDDQSIYGFRGANPSIMQNFRDDFEGCKTILLDRNFRCPQNIVSAAGMLISNNQLRFDKNIVATNPNGILEVIDVLDKQAEAKLVCSKIQELRESGADYKDMAILFRNNTQGQAMISQLVESKIPFYLKDNMPNVYNHFIFLDLECYFKVALGLHDRATLLRIINRPARYIQRAALEGEFRGLDQVLEYYEGASFMEKRVEGLITDLELIKRMSPFSAANYIKKAMGYEAFVKQEAVRLGQNLEDVMEVFEVFDEIAKSTKSLPLALEKIEALRIELDLKNKEKSKARGNQVGLYTLHGSKGLEFKICFIVDVNESIIPSKKATLPGQIEEERRMFYVGMTRAKEQLYLFYIQKKNQEGMYPSRFINELQLDE